MFIEDYIITVVCSPDQTLASNEHYLFEESPSNLKIKDYLHVQVNRFGKEIVSIHSLSDRKYATIYFYHSGGLSITSNAKSVKRLCEIGMKNMERKEAEYCRLIKCL